FSQAAVPPFAVPRLNVSGAACRNLMPVPLQTVTTKGLPSPNKALIRCSHLGVVRIEPSRTTPSVAPISTRSSGLPAVYGKPPCPRPQFAVCHESRTFHLHAK